MESLTSSTGAERQQSGQRWEKGEVQEMEHDTALLRASQPGLCPLLNSPPPSHVLHISLLSAPKGSNQCLLCPRAVYIQDATDTSLRSAPQILPTTHPDDTIHLCALLSVCVCVCECTSGYDFPPCAYKDAWHFRILWITLTHYLYLCLFFSLFLYECSKPTALASSFLTFLLPLSPDFYPSALETARHLWFWRNAKGHPIPWLSHPWVRIRLILVLNRSPSSLPICGLPEPVRLPLRLLRCLPVDSPTSSPVTPSLFTSFSSFCPLNMDFLQNSVLSFPSLFSSLVISPTS